MNAKTLAIGGGAALLAFLIFRKKAMASIPSDQKGSSAIPKTKRSVEQWRSLAEKHAGPAGIAVAWVLAIIARESGGDPNARAKDPRDLARGGSWGLMQMSYKTAQGLGFTGAPEDLLDPDTNVQLGVKLLAQLKKRFGDSLKDVAAGYNSGKKYEKAPAVTRNEYVPFVEKQAQAFAGIGFASLKNLDSRKG